MYLLGSTHFLRNFCGRYLVDKVLCSWYSGFFFWWSIFDKTPVAVLYLIGSFYDKAELLFSEIFLSQFQKVEKASTEEVDAAHKQYLAALASLYLKHNTDENVSLIITWSILLLLLHLYAIDKMLMV